MGRCGADLADALYSVQTYKKAGGKCMDRIVMQNNMALAAGMTYGKWKALHPESEIIEEEPDEPEEVRLCQNCGRPIPHPLVLKGRIDRYSETLYCSNRCKQAAHSRRKGVPEKAKKVAVDYAKKPGKCEWCGKQIPAFNENGRKNSFRKMFCSTHCQSANYYHKRKEAAKCQA
jgi:hypothetical protein